MLKEPIISDAAAVDWDARPSTPTLSVAVDSATVPEEAPERSERPVDPGFVPDEPDRDPEPEPEPEPELVETPEADDPLLGDTGLSPDGYLFDDGPLDLAHAFTDLDGDLGASIQGLIDRRLGREVDQPITGDMLLNGDFSLMPGELGQSIEEAIYDYFVMAGVQRGEITYTDPGAIEPVPVVDDPLVPVPEPVVDPGADLLLG